ncbi:MAG: polyprenol monophosphomannose synthase, partial [Flavobacteriales bacterium]
MNDNLVIIPTYNERENVVRMLETVMALPFPFDVLVVDDGSPDGTAGLVKETATSHPERIHLLEREGKLGLGTAYIAGFKWALAQGYDYVFEMDCDFSHDPEDLVRLRVPCAEGGAGMSVGSRYIKGGGVANWPLNRLILSYGASLYVNLMLGLGVRDATAGFVCYRREVLEKIQLDAVQFVGYAFQIEMKLRAKRNGYQVKEVPITFVDRELGTSKMSMNIFREALLGVLQMRTQRIFFPP